MVVKHYTNYTVNYLKCDKIVNEYIPDKSFIMLNVLVFKTLKAINQICMFGIIYFDYSMAVFLVY
jgi:hypothetical protein